jgi:hypothetical protein
MATILNWQILLKTLPLTVGFCLLKVVLHQFGWEPWQFDALTGTLFGAATFVVALVLSGTLADYRACETMPMQVANAIATMQDSNAMVAASYPHYDPLPLQNGLLAVLERMQEWLQEGKEIALVEEAVDQLNLLFVPIAQQSGAIASRLQTEQAKLRFLVASIQSNRDTDFLGQAYVLLWIFLLGTVAALLLSGAELFSENLTVSAFMFTSFVYLVIFIRDLDNPFQYDGRSSVDVDLSPLKHMGDRLKGE